MQQSHDRLSIYLDKMASDVDWYKERLDYLGTKREQVETEVERIIDSIQECLMQKKDEMLEELNDLYSSERQNLQIDIRDKQTAVAETKHSLETMEDLMESSSDDEAFELWRTLEQKCIDYAFRQEEDKTRLVDLIFSVNFEKLMNAVEGLPFGDVDVLYDLKGITVMKRPVSESSSTPSPSTSPSPSPTSSPAKLNSNPECGDEAATGKSQEKPVIYTRVEEDKNKPKLNDIAVVHVNDKVVVVVTDRANKCIKAFYKINNKPFYSLESTSAQPKGIARVGECKVGVTFPDSRSIKLFRITPALRRDKDIRTSKGYRGIATLDSERMVVSTYRMFPNSVEIIDFQGNVLRSIIKDRNGDNLFDYPFYLCTTLLGNIIVSDCERKTVTCVSQTGKIIFQYGQGAEVTVTYPLGVALNRCGDILVVDCDNHKVVKIFEDGQGAKSFLGMEDGILGPYSVDIDCNGVVYVVEWNGNIKMFDKT